MNKRYDGLGIVMSMFSRNMNPKGLQRSGIMNSPTPVVHEWGKLLTKNKFYNTIYNIGTVFSVTKEIVITMNRRNFLSTGTMALGSVSLLKDIPSSFVTGTTKFFFAKSGVIGTNNSVYTGMLKTTDYNNDSLALVTERTNLNFHSELRYSSNDKYKVPFAISVIDRFISQSTLSLVVSRVTEAPSFLPGSGLIVNKSRLEKAKTKASYVESLITELGPETSNEVVMKSEYAFGSGRQFRDLFKNRGDITTTDKIYYEEDLLQMASLIVSCIKADLVGTPVNAVNSQILAHLKKELGVSDFTQMNNGKLKVI